MPNVFLIFQPPLQADSHLLMKRPVEDAQLTI